MKKLDFSNIKLIDKYYREKFTFDVSNYFQVNGWRQFNYRKDFEVTTDTYISSLYTRGTRIINGEPAVYMGCGPWWDKNQNFEFSGMFAYMYIASKCIRKHCGNEDAFLFCKEFTFPLILDNQALEDFDVVATLKEACIAPYKAEAENYLSMMWYVMPYMKEITSDFIGKLKPEVIEEIELRLEEFRKWVESTQDEALSFYGLAVRKEYMPAGSPYPAKYYLLDSLCWYSKRYNVYSFDEIIKLGNKRSPFAYGDITEFDGPIVPHYEDLEYIKRTDEEHKSCSFDEPFPETTKQEEKENMLYNIIINLMWNDETYEKDGQTGLKDCWGRVLVPAEYENCVGVSNSRFLTNKDVCVLIKKEGKWALSRRRDEHEKMTDYLFDEANLVFQGYYITRIENRYGLYTTSGRELLPTGMEDIYHPTVCEHHIMYKQDGKYGILFYNGTLTKQLLDEVRVNCGHYLSVRKENDWGYLDKEGNFTRKRNDAFVISNGFDFNSMAIYECGFNMDVDIEECVTLDEMMENLKRNFYRFSVDIDLQGSRLEGLAKVCMGLNKPVLYYEILHDGATFCIDMQRPYQMKLQDDRYHDMQQSWDGHEKELEQLKNWLNEPNPKTGVRNWAEVAYEHCIARCNEGRSLTISYAYRKALAFDQMTLNDIDNCDFPEIDFK